MNVLDLYRETGALHEGHFLLASGRHSPMFLQSTTVLQYPHHAEKIGRAMAAQVRAAGLAPSFVIGPAMGGVTLAYEVARHLDARALFAEKEYSPDGTRGAMTVRDAFVIAPGETFIAVEDVVTTGGSVLKAVRAAEERGGRALAIACIVDRRRDGGPLGEHPLLALERLYFDTYPPSELPDWLAERPLQEI
ncbi:orotate phosphoribosyltransferase [Deinococcus peraridilitoris]|uniref:Orotate phosphoribosyltransferase n=1 Tax=Deinococcus peraridilitoris (strain DSM 19664 / LMG 22246 / CIP 109416 / KR-200) TaxID=937777 RepID=K9ZY29_DEIPD|nr:orotate phosphoribosyltransferase [Deinococcus peraridilitoris]AFZ66511.1 orotate phosphoribosyltransferase [Deinococcus peraridilitoris DSM 19664]